MTFKLQKALTVKQDGDIFKKYNNIGVFVQPLYNETIKHDVTDIINNLDIMLMSKWSEGCKQFSLLLIPISCSNGSR